MRGYIFTFALHTKEDVVDGSIFDRNGEVIGRVIHKRMLKASDHFTYDVETTKDIYEGIQSGEIKLWGVEDYFVTNSSFAYYRE